MVDKEQGKRRTFEKIANMQLSGMPNEAIAKVMAVTPPAISQITKREDYLAVKEEIFEHSFQKQKEIADMWDDAEHKALTGIAANMKWNADPEFALKVAAVANKAQRRGSAQNGNQPLSADVGRVVNIQLSNIYVNQITNGAEGQPETIEHRSMQNRVEDRTTEKMSDNLSKKAVEKLFDVTDEPASALRGETKLAQGLNALLNGVVPQLAVG